MARVDRPFIGRDWDLGELGSLMAQASDGHGNLALIAGEPGIGKTRLAEEVADRARDRGATVAWGACWAGEGAAAYWPWIQVIRGLAEEPQVAPAFQGLGRHAVELARLVPGIAEPPATPTSPEQDVAVARFPLFDAVGTLLSACSRLRPLLVVLDDLHWADSPSLMLLEFVARDLRAARILGIGTYRDVEVTAGDPLARTLGQLGRDAVRIELHGLGAGEVRDLVHTLTGEAPSDDLTEALHERTAGNPFFVRELVRLLAAQGRLRGDARTAVAVPEGVREVIERRLARLTQGCAQTLAIAAVLGLEFDLELLERVADVRRGTLFDLVDEATAARILHPVPGAVHRFAFAHALVRETLYDGLGAARRADLHRRAGDAMEALYGSGLESRLSEVAHHFLEASADGDPANAIAYAERAGHRALAMLAFEDAIAQFRRALALIGGSDGDRAGPRLGLLLALGEALVRSGDMPQAREAYEEAASLARALGRTEDLARAALGFGAGLGGFEIQLWDRRQIEVLEEALAVLPAEDSALRARVMARLSVALSFLEPEERRHRLAEDAVAMARRIGDRAALAYALSAHCDAIAGPEHVTERMAEATEIVKLGREAATAEMTLLGRRFRVVALLEVGDLRGVDAEIEAYADVADRLRQPLYLWYVPLWRGMRALLGGDLRKAEILAEEGAEVGRQAHSENAVILTATLRGGILRERGDPQGFLHAMSPWLADDRFAPLSGIAAAALAELGDRDGAARALGRFTANGLRDIPRDAEWLEALVQGADGCILLGDREAAGLLYPELEPYASLCAVDGIGACCYGVVARPLGGLAALLGRRSDATAHFEAALAANERMEAPLLLARTRMEFGRALVDWGSSERGEALIRQATEAFRNLGVPGRGGEPEAAAAPQVRGPNVFRLEGEVWTLAFSGSVARVRDSKGMRDLAALLAQPGREIAALDLLGRGHVGRPTATLPGGPEGDLGEVLDGQARAAYRARLAELEEEVTELEGSGDAGRASRAREERDFLAAELAAAYGLGGRARRSGSPAERARKAVTWRIRDALARLERPHPPLWWHLRHSIRTGTFCSYQPEQPVRWEM